LYLHVLLLLNTCVKN